MHLLWFEERAAFNIANEGVVSPAIPEAGHDIEELPAPPVALAVLHMFFQTEVERRVRVGRGDQIPASAPAAQVVERGKAARDVIRLIERGGRGRDQTDPLGHCRECRQ